MVADQGECLAGAEGVEASVGDSGRDVPVASTSSDVGNDVAGNVGDGTGEDDATSGPIPENVNPSEVPADEATGCG